MPLAALYAFILWLLPRLFTQILILFGISVIAYSGIDLLFDQVESAVTNSWQGVSSDVITLVALSGFGVVIKMHLSCFAAVLTYKTTIGAFKKIRF